MRETQTALCPTGNSEFLGAAQRVRNSAQVFSSTGMCSTVKLNSASHKAKLCVLCTVWLENSPRAVKMCDSRVTLATIAQLSRSGVDQRDESPQNELEAKAAGWWSHWSWSRTLVAISPGSTSVNMQAKYVDGASVKRGKHFPGSGVAKVTCWETGWTRNGKAALCSSPCLERVIKHSRLLAEIMKRVLSLKEAVKRLDNLREARYCGSKGTCSRAQKGQIQ